MFKSFWPSDQKTSDDIKALQEIKISIRAQAEKIEATLAKKIKEEEVKND